MRGDIFEVGEIDMSTLNDYPVPVAQYDHASVQIIPISPASTAVLEVKKSLTGDRADAVSFGTAVNPSLSTRAISEGIDVTDLAYLHLQVTTAESGVRYRAVVYLTNWTK